jgi:hypothetical protein
MRPLAALERFLERLFERPTARLLGASLEPVTLARRLERAIDEERRAGAGGMLAPTRFAVVVSAADAASLARIATLEDDLAAAALDHARRRGYRIPERPTVAVVGSPALEAGDVRVTAGFAEGRRAPVEPDAQPERTLVHPLPRAVPPGAVLRVTPPGGPPRDVPLGRRPATIGRAGDAEVVLADPLVSRHHARLAVRGDRLVLVDLGSTNGTRVNGGVVREAVVGPGDRIEIGATRLEIVVPNGAAEGGWTPA